MTLKEMISLNIRIKKMINKWKRAGNNYPRIIDVRKGSRCYSLVGGGWIWLKGKIVSAFGRINDKPTHMMIWAITEIKIEGLLLTLMTMIGDNDFITIHIVQIV